MRYISTRDSKKSVSAIQAILEGISSDGGLYVPSELPFFSEKDLDNLAAVDYQGKAVEIMLRFLPEFSNEEITDIMQKSASRFDEGIIAPIVKLDENLYILELWHGPTYAFKDVALTVLPNLMSLARKKAGLKEKILILTATSGDTGKAALEGFKDIEGISVATLYPSQNVSEHQKLQMITQEGNNVLALGIEGNFDDTQTAVKKIFTDKQIAEEFKNLGYVLSSANSINWGRLLPQIVYYFSSYLDMRELGEIKRGEKINFVVPSGNFGNILAGLYAMKMGLPINKLICASNSNNVLTDFLNNGNYDVRRTLKKTISPSMDILISSNTERLLFEISGRDSEETKNRMEHLKTNGEYLLRTDELEKLHEVFFADYSSDDSTRETLYNIFMDKDYLMDPHTAVAMDVYNSYLMNEDDQNKSVIISTANPYKFVPDVLEALKISVPSDELKAINKLNSKTSAYIPEGIIKAYGKKKIHSKIISKEDILENLLQFIKKQKGNN